MSVRVYVEGGGNNKDTIKRCKEGFARYCQKLAPANRRLAIVACGSRQKAFDRFRTALQTIQAGEICALLVDSEGSVNVASAAQHLRDRDGWEFPDDHCQIFLMVQVMEAWFLADREALAEFYGQGFLASSLPGNPRIEEILKQDLERCLKHASRPTRTKGAYHKVRHGFELLALIDPAKVEMASSRARCFNDFLRAL